ncbi:hypothetical protein NQZ68_035418 [Dissostichus eleginoides]|nr:hypothetical protein NQZ68_035418 [Dissostichus eleginoides]
MEEGGPEGETTQTGPQEIRSRTCSRPTRDQIQDLQPAHKRSDPGRGNVRKQTQPGTAGGEGSREAVEKDFRSRL